MQVQQPGTRPVCGAGMRLPTDRAGWATLDGNLCVARRRLAVPRVQRAELCPAHRVLPLRRAQVSGPLRMACDLQ